MLPRMSPAAVADALEATTFAPAATSAFAGAAELVEPAETALGGLVVGDLIEEISIDGMCGVY